MADDPFDDVFETGPSGTGPSGETTPGETPPGDTPSGDPFDEILRQTDPRRGAFNAGGGPVNPYETGGEAENRAPRALHEKEVRVLGVWEARDPTKPDAAVKETYVLLRDGAGRKLRIFIGPFEAMAIVKALEGSQPERPFTHDLLRQCIERLDATIERVIIDDLWASTYYAKIVLERESGAEEEIDARPSDALAIALRVSAPIFVAEDVLATGAIEE